MRLLKQGNGFKILASDVPSAAVPYQPEKHEDGENYGFVDLCNQPDRVDGIPEAKKVGGLAELLRATNAIGSPLMSIGCECAYFDEPYRHAGSYIQITYRDFRNADRNTLTRLAGHMAGSVRFSGAHPIKLLLIVEPLISFFGKPGRFALMVKIFGSGETVDECWRSLDYGLRELASAIRLQATDGPSTD